MRYAEARQGRTFVIRLEHGEVVHAAIESFARSHSVRAATLMVLGGADVASTLVVGPRDADERPITPMTRTLEEVHEVTGTGTLFPDEAGNPVLHMHLSCGRDGVTTTGCIRSGVKVWQVMEIVLCELVDCHATRATDAGLGFKLLSL